MGGCTSRRHVGLEWSNMQIEVTKHRSHVCRSFNNRQMYLSIDKEGRNGQTLHMFLGSRDTSCLRLRRQGRIN